MGAVPAFTAWRVTTLAIDPKLPATVYAGTMGDAIYKSPDGGQHWLPHNVGLKEHVSFINEIIFHPDNTELIYLATTVGAFISKNGGREWEERMAGMKEVHIVTCITMDHQHPRVLVRGDDQWNLSQRRRRQLLAEEESGLIPEEVLNAAMALGVNMLAVDPRQSEIVYAATTKGLFRSTDQAEHWTEIGQGLSNQFVSALACIRPTRTSLHRGGRHSQDGRRRENLAAEESGADDTEHPHYQYQPEQPRGALPGTNGSGLYRSTDGGQNWAPIPLTSPTQTPPKA